MNQYNFLVNLSIFASILLIFAVQSKKIKVEVYTEGLCPDSSKFLHDQLAPNWDSLKSGLDLDILAFGRANFSNSNNYSSVVDGDEQITFQCPHGPKECVIDKMMACARNRFLGSDPSKYVKYITCLQGEENFYLYPENSIKKSQELF